MFTTILLFQACGVDLCSNFTSQGGIISSPDFPSDYGNNRNCDITISSPSRSSISVNFTTFVVEREYDFISVSQHSFRNIL